MNENCSESLVSGVQNSIWHPRVQPTVTEREKGFVRELCEEVGGYSG